MAPMLSVAALTKYDAAASARVSLFSIIIITITCIRIQYNVKMSQAKFLHYYDKTTEPLPPPPRPKRRPYKKQN